MVLDLAGVADLRDYHVSNKLIHDYLHCLGELYGSLADFAENSDISERER